jgi:carbon monoxide dehydrogenase subunit G
MELLGEHSVVVNAPPDVVWQALVDWQSWPEWDKGQESIKFKGPLNVGSSGKLKIRGGPKVTLRITDFEPGKEYTSEFHLLGSRFIFNHNIEPEGENTRVSFAVHLTGFLSVVAYGFFRSSLESNLPEWMTNFKRRTEALNR